MSINTISESNTQSYTRVSDYSDAKNQAIVAPANQKGISGFVFDIPMGEEVALESDITDHYVESGSFLNDHVVRKPQRITLSGLVGELAYTPPDDKSIEGLLSNLENSLGVVDAYLGPFTEQMTQKVQAVVAQAAYVANQAKAIAKRASNLVGYFSDDPESLTKQQNYYLSLKALWLSNQIVTVQTPWEFFPQMMIQSITFRQDDKTEDVTDMTVILKEVRFADVETKEFNDDLFPPATEMQKSQNTDLGKVQGKEDTISTLGQLTGKYQ